MNIVQSYIINNDNYKANVNRIDSRYTTFQNRGPLGLLIHSVGCPQPNPEVFFRSWNQPGKQVSVHAMGDGNRILQFLPWNYRAWHAGGDANNTHVGYEMTEPSFIQYTSGSNWVVKSGYNLTHVENFVRGTYATAVELFAMLCKQYKLDPLKDGVIISHSEGYKRKIASNHGDVEHIWKKFGMSMNQFRQDIKKAMTPTVVAPPVVVTPPVVTPTPPKGSGDNPSSWAKEGTDWAKSIKLFEGDGQGNFDWQDPTTREMAAVVFHKFTNLVKL